MRYQWGQRDPNGDNETLLGTMRPYWGRRGTMRPYWGQGHTSGGKGTPLKTGRSQWGQGDTSRGRGDTSEDNGSYWGKRDPTGDNETLLGTRRHQ